MSGNVYSGDNSMPISIHAPQWGATICPPTITRFTIFQSTHPSGVRPTAYGSVFSSLEFQSTHPSGVRPDKGKKVRALSKISIHAPQWGATPRPRPRRTSSPNFNPRTPVGCDPSPARWRGGPGRISIHAPQWGATDFNNAGYAFTLNFNPRTPVGCDSRRC